MKTKTKKILSILLALMMLLSVVPFYASAAAETLTEANVQTWPTLSYRHPDGVMYYGMTVAEGLTINDDEVVIDATGNQVAGHFEFVSPTKVLSGSNRKADLLFVPDDTDAYSTIKKNRSPVLYDIQNTQLVLIDENNPPVAISKIVKGATLSTVEITGGQVKNPYVETDSRADGAYWEWVNPDTIVTESGEFEATLHTAGGSYEPMTRMVYVEVESSIEATKIVEAPTATLEYGQYFSEAVFEGGKVMAGDKEVSGTFTRKSTSVVKPIVGVFDAVEVIFTPDDLEKYAPCEGTAVVTVTKGSYKLVDKNGEEVTVPEITLPYGAKFDRGDALGVTLKLMIKDRSSLSGADAPFISFPDHDTEEIAPVGTNTYTVRIYPSHEGNSNYQTTYRQFVLTIEPVIITTTAYWNTAGVLGGKLSHKAKGTLDVFVDGKLVADDIKAGGANNEWSVDYPIPATGDYTIKVVYNPTENDPYSMVDFEKVVTAKIRRSITYADPSAVNHKINGDERTPIATLGDTIELSTFGGVAFLGWKITDMNGNEVDLGIADLTATEITFTMPDYDLFVEAMYQKDEPADDNNGIGGIFGDLDLGDLTEGDSDNPFENIINNLIAFFKNIINTIKNFFRGIGDLT